jgi:Fur family transcriptional regulator, ferric uptake regulator
MKRHCGMWGHKLRNHGFKCTPGREMILEVLESTNEHLSPEEIFSKAQKSCPELGLTTVYRTLEMLINLGMVIKLDIGDGKSRYELSESVNQKKHHHHLVCNGCGKIIDYSDFMNEEMEYLSKIEKALEKKHNFKINNHVIQFYGKCITCGKKEKTL